MLPEQVYRRLIRMKQLLHLMCCLKYTKSHLQYEKQLHRFFRRHRNLRAKVEIAKTSKAIKKKKGLKNYFDHIFHLRLKPSFAYSLSLVELIVAFITALRISAPRIPQNKCTTASISTF